MSVTVDNSTVAHSHIILVPESLECALTFINEMLAMKGIDCRGNHAVGLKVLTRYRIMPQARQLPQIRDHMPGSGTIVGCSMSGSEREREVLRLAINVYRKLY